MPIIYIISLITLYISFFLIKKSNKELDMVSWIGIDIVLLLCYNTIICYIYTTVGIPINLGTLSIINYILSIIFTIMIKKKRQKYNFKKIDLIIICIIVAVTAIFAYLNFGFPLEIKYVMTDSAVHYNATNNFFKSENLLIKSGNDMMPGAYSNAGVLQKVFSPYMEFVELYKVFIAFDVFMFFMTGFLMYIALKQLIKSKYEIIISAIITIIYMIGYPLNVMLFGYFYLQLGIIVFSTLVILMEYFKEEIIDSKYLILMLFLLNLELFFSYYLFIPVVYGALFIYYIMFFYKKNNKLINKELIIYIVITLIIPCIIGFIYNILPGMKSLTEIKAINQIGWEGYIYRNLYSNIILFLPFVLVYIYNKKKINYNVLLLVLLVAFMCLLYIGCLFKIVSTYYFYKTYFILWFLLIYLFAHGIFYAIRKSNKGKKLATTYIVIYIILLIISLFTQNIKITKKTISDETILDVMDIYGLNKTILTEEESDFTLEEIEILKYVSDNIEIAEETEILILGQPKQEYWFWGIFGYKNRKDPEIMITHENIKEWNENKKFDYLICFNRSAVFQHYKNYVNLDKQLLYSNDSGIILKNK